MPNNWRTRQVLDDFVKRLQREIEVLSEGAKRTPPAHTPPDERTTGSDLIRGIAATNFGTIADAMLLVISIFGKLSDELARRIARKNIGSAGPIEVSRYFLWQQSKTNPDATGLRAELLLTNVGAFIPRCHREALIGDLMEDLRDYRAIGFTERRLVCHVIWQLAWVLVARISRLGVIAWVGSSIWKKISG